MSREAQRRIVAVGIWLAIFYVAYFILPAYFREYLLNPLADFIQANYGFVFDRWAGRGNTGEIGAWILVIGFLGFIARQMATEVGVLLVLLITWGLISRGAPTVVERNGQLVPIQNAEVRQIGRLIAITLGAFLLLLILGHLVFIGPEHVLLPAVGATIMGYYGPELKIQQRGEFGRTVVGIFLVMLLVPPIMRHVWMALYHINSPDFAVFLSYTVIFILLFGGVAIAWAGVGLMAGKLVSVVRGK